MSNLKISIVTSCFNSEKTIAQCIESVVHQTYKNLEYIVIDAQSTDSTCDVISRYRDRIHFFVSEPDGGIYSGWNKGIRKASGDYILILNSDDKLYDPKVIEDAAREIGQRNLPRILCGKVKTFEARSGYSFLSGKPTTLNKLVYKMGFPILSAFISKEAYAEIGLYDEKYKISSDYDWAIRAHKQYDASFILFFDRVIVLFSLEGESNKRYKLAYQEISKMIRGHYDFFAYLRNLIYVKYLFFLKSILPFVRAMGILFLWRKVKNLLKRE